MKLAPRPPRKRHEDRDLTPAIIAAINRIPGTRCHRNISQTLPLANGGFQKVGLGDGSPDIVGIVRIAVGYARTVGQAFSIEVKWADAGLNEHGRGGHEEQQRAWQRAFVALGGLHVTVRAKDADDAARQALDAVGRWKRGEGW